MVAVELPTAKHVIEDNYVDNVIPLPNDTRKILLKIFKYGEHRVETTISSTKADDKLATAVFDEEIKAFDANFVKPNHALRPNSGINLRFLYCSNLILGLHVAYSYLLGAQL